MGVSLSFQHEFTIVVSSAAADTDTCVSLASAASVSGSLPARVRFRVLPNLLGNFFYYVYLIMTYVTDPIGDLLTRMRNAQRVRHTECEIPWSRLKEQLCEILRDNGWIADVRTIGEDLGKKLQITFAEDKPLLELKRISKPGRRVYKGVEELRPVLRGFGMAILTTSQGLMSDKDARGKKIGGEVLCTIS